jgi:outer membrane autotransporter protein
MNDKLKKLLLSASGLAMIASAQGAYAADVAVDTNASALDATPNLTADVTITVNDDKIVDSLTTTAPNQGKVLFVDTKFLTVNGSIGTVENYINNLKITNGESGKLSVTDAHVGTLISEGGDGATLNLIKGNLHLHKGATDKTDINLGADDKAAGVFSYTDLTLGTVKAAHANALANIGAIKNALTVTALDATNKYSTFTIGSEGEDATLILTDAVGSTVGSIVVNTKENSIFEITANALTVTGAVGSAEMPLTQLKLTGADSQLVLNSNPHIGKITTTAAGAVIKLNTAGDYVLNTDPASTQGLILDVAKTASLAGALTKLTSVTVEAGQALTFKDEVIGTGSATANGNGASFVFEKNATFASLLADNKQSAATLNEGVKFTGNIGADDGTNQSLTLTLKGGSEVTGTIGGQGNDANYVGTVNVEGSTGQVVKFGNTANINKLVLDTAGEVEATGNLKVQASATFKKDGVLSIKGGTDKFVAVTDADNTGTISFEVNSETGSLGAAGKLLKSLKLVGDKTLEVAGDVYAGSISSSVPSNGTVVIDAEAGNRTFKANMTSRLKGFTAHTQGTANTVTVDGEILADTVTIDAAHLTLNQATLTGTKLDFVSDHSVTFKNDILLNIEADAGGNRGAILAEKNAVVTKAVGATTALTLVTFNGDATLGNSKLNATAAVAATAMEFKATNITFAGANKTLKLASNLDLVDSKADFRNLHTIDLGVHNVVNGGGANDDFKIAGDTVIKTTLAKDANDATKLVIGSLGVGKEIDYAGATDVKFEFTLQAMPEFNVDYKVAGAGAADVPVSQVEKLFLKSEIIGTAAAPVALKFTGLNDISDTLKDKKINKASETVVKSLVKAEGYNYGLAVAFLNFNKGQEVEAAALYNGLIQESTGQDSVDASTTLSGTTVNAHVDQQVLLMAPASAGEAYAVNQGLWVEGFGKKATQSTLQGMAYESNIYGGTAGYDLTINPNHTIGLALTYAKTDTKHKGIYNGSTTKVSSYALSLYGAHSLGSGVSLATHVFGSTNKVKEAHKHSNGAVGKSAYDVTQYGLGAKLLYTTCLNDMVDITPYAGLQFGHSQQGTKTESGAGALDFAYKSDKARKNLVGTLGLTLSKLLNVNGTTVLPSLSAAVVHDMLSDKPQYKVSAVTGVGSDIEIEGTVPTRTGVKLEAAVLAKLDDTYDVSVRLGSMFKRKYHDVSGALRVRVNF